MVPDGIAFCRCASLIGDRATLVNGDEGFVQRKKEELEDILGGVNLIFLLRIFFESFFFDNLFLYLALFLCAATHSGGDEEKSAEILKAAKVRAEDAASQPFCLVPSL